jgi:hypothetical protein
VEATVTLLVKGGAPPEIAADFAKTYLTPIQKMKFQVRCHRCHPRRAQVYLQTAT